MEEVNKRKNVRVRFTTNATLRFADQSFTNLETSNMSLKGVYVLGVSGIAKGAKCGVSLHLSGATSELMVKMTGEVVRVEEDGVALRFSEIDLDSFFHLRNIVYFNSENPDVVEEELVAGFRTSSGSED